MAEIPPQEQVAPLRDQVAIITGASHGIGTAIARQLARMGAHVTLAARNAARLKVLEEEIAAEGGRASAHPTDLCRPEQVQALVEGTLRRQQRLDILVNNAGIGTFGAPLHETTLEVWEATMATNLRAVYLAIRAAAPHMIQRRSGHIVNISSLAGYNPVPLGAAYAASKWALNGLIRSCAEELRAFGIRVSLVAPGSVNTGLVPGSGKDRSRMLQPDDVAHAVAMLVTQAPQSFVSEVLLRPTEKP